MKTPYHLFGGAAVCAGLVLATCAAAQTPREQPQATGAPSTAPGAASTQLQEGGNGRRPYTKPLSAGQEIAAGLPQAGAGGLFPIPPLVPGTPMPSADARDFSGTWYHDQNLKSRNTHDIYEQPIPYTVAGALVLKRRVGGILNGKPYLNASAICRPPGPQWQRDLTFPFQIFQSDQGLEFVFREYHGRWNVAFDPKMLPTEKQYMGRSVAHWDGDTLVVDSSDFAERTWFDTNGTPLSKSARLNQRIRKVIWEGDVPYLEITTTVIDPIYYTRPWTIVRLFSWDPHQTLFTEYNCEEQIGDPTVNADAGLLPEPED